MNDRTDQSDDRIDASVVSPAVTAQETGARETRPSPSGPPASRPPAGQPPLRAWVLALTADALQWLLLPLLGPGFASPADVALDLVVAVALVRWCGWHWAFLPTVVAELIPGVDLVPTWTAAVWLAAWTRRGEARAG